MKLRFHTKRRINIKKMKESLPADMREALPTRVEAPPEPTYDQSDPALHDEQQVARTELLMVKGIRQKRMLMTLLSIADHRKMDRYIARVLARWELVGTSQDHSRARGEALTRLDLIDSELWSKLQNQGDVRVSIVILSTLLNVQRQRTEVLGLTPKVIERIGSLDSGNVAFSKQAAAHERLSMLAARMLRMVEEREGRVIEHEREEET
jgi:hypothetical protein